MPLNTLVVANSEPANHRIAYAISRELARLSSGMQITIQPNLQKAHAAVQMNDADFSLVIADAPSIGNDFLAATKILPNRPLILLQDKDMALDNRAADALGIAFDLIVTRPFPTGSLCEKVEHVLRDEIAPPQNLRGLFTNKARTKVFYDGRQLNGLLSVERDLLVFLMQNKTENMPFPTLIQNFREKTPGMTHYDDEAIARIMDTFSSKLMKRLEEMTEGNYALNRAVDNKKKFKGCALVCRAA